MKVEKRSKKSVNLEVVPINERKIQENNMQQLQTTDIFASAA